MAEKLKKVECDPKCGFVIQSHDEKEVIDIALKHAKKAHNMTVTEKDVRGMMKDA
jgi:predicted small metal-binding protein